MTNEASRHSEEAKLRKAMKTIQAHANQGPNIQNLSSLSGCHIICPETKRVGQDHSMARAGHQPKEVMGMFTLFFFLHNIHSGWLQYTQNHGTKKASRHILPNLAAYSMLYKYSSFVRCKQPLRQQR
ncbi:hypothetical protein P7K49_015586 [Saguinus oedipus]|uniref:Uncharacterized protein n=1 Tax=Saguinus oedipus TaxID=9490 RepID=A0ABQ9VCJ6_SAGOE|nr:hypothetical protein P7K49_015586 [Saguinus oedipus]